MKALKLATGEVALVDDEDFEALSKYRWRLFRTGGHKYVARHGRNAERQPRLFYLHREIMRPPEGMCVDHVNNDPLDNRRENLRLATYAQNAQNCKLYKSNTTGYKGIQRKGDKFKVEIQFNRVRLRSDPFDSLEDAVHYYNEVTGRLFGEFANPNPLPQETTESNPQLF